MFLLKPHKRSRQCLPIELWWKHWCKRIVDWFMFWTMVINWITGYNVIETGMAFLMHFLVVPVYQIPLTRLWSLWLYGRKHISKVLVCGIEPWTKANFLTTQSHMDSWKQWNIILETIVCKVFHSAKLVENYYFGHLFATKLTGFIVDTMQPSLLAISSLFVCYFITFGQF